MSRRAALFYTIGFGGLVVGLAVLQGVLERKGGAAQVGAPAPDFSVARLAGGRLRLSELRGKVVLVDFWARWCKPCVGQMDGLERLHRKLSGKPFVLLSVNIESAPAAAVRAWLAERGLTFEAAQDGAGVAQATYRVSSIPYLVLVDRTGTVRQVYSAGVSESRIARDVEALLAS